MFAGVYTMISKYVSIDLKFKWQDMESLGLHNSLAYSKIE